ncbi:PSD1 and planctomycete cytochrome C domain-containing protein [Fimbriiglobus ruber]|uniref:Cytochrome c domain-containing protein n=1 Tax=Fimbriiglobus ruber TaxID=1908690 RepID=A0A225E485_9BACT|nr:PSD1 and planctomycete cytochrome C domain-containing protein [Fimbriiglobus ruber]OWK46564.1 protein of unknown function DUF1549 [Fimbriiglobus ruber]
MSRAFALALCIWLTWISTARCADPVPADHAAKMTRGTELFKSRVREVFVKNCLRCHGGKKTEAGFDLATRDAALKGGEHGRAVVPGDAKGSLLYQLVAHQKMPDMPENADKLPESAIKTIAEWIDLGAPYDAPLLGRDAKSTLAGSGSHWSFQPVVRSEPPQVKNTSWPRDPVDRFVLAKLEARGLKPAPAADRRTLIRRVTFDLTGLPPTPEAVEAFVADTTPNAYEKVIDNLLASPAYGEHWGRHWLDLVRYCDSFDSRVTGKSDHDCLDAWRYRDWVVASLNRDLPYDQFVRMQLAGDLLPLPEAERPDGIVATGMLALGNWGGGDADKDKLLTDIVDDQIDVVGRSLLGLTIACARCHDHKFDPIATRDYYRLAGIFFSTHILPSVGLKTDGPPMLRIPLETATLVRQREDRERQLKDLEQALTAALVTQRERAKQRFRDQLPAHLLAAHDLTDPAALAAAAKAKNLNPRWLRLCRGTVKTAPGTLLGTHLPDALGIKGLHVWRNHAECFSFTVNVSGNVAHVSTLAMPPKTIAAHPGSATDVALVWTSPVAGSIELRGKLTDLDASCGDGVTWELRVIPVPGGAASLAAGTIDNGRAEEFGRAKILTTHVSPGDRIELVVKRRAEYTCDTTGLEFVVSQGAQKWNAAADWVAAIPSGPAKVGPWTVEDVRDSTPPLPPAVAGALAKWATARADTVSGKRTRPALESAARETAAVISAAGGAPFIPATGDLSDLDTPEGRAAVDRIRTEIAGLKKELAAPRSLANGAQDGGVPGSPHAGIHDVKVHLRGRYDRLGDLVSRGFPAVIHVANPPEIQTGSGRKELADWITRADHPLTSRVIANRVWQFHFGEGLVRTPSNFGALGERPTHPELLDYLARTLVDGGWSLKAFHKRLLLTATYRQSAAADPATLAADPDNKLWGRYPRHRLEAEAIRDSLLFVAGKLDSARGGLATRDFNAPRRSLYLMTIRSDRTGFGPLFDAADSTSPVEKRTVSTVAPQALFLMNHPFVKKQAAALAARVLGQPGADADRLDFAARVVFGRAATSDERKIGLEFLKVSDSTREAWAAWCHLLLETNEFAVVE